jgi:hypothetical protein
MSRRLPAHSPALEWQCLLIATRMSVFLNQRPIRHPRACRFINFCAGAVRIQQISKHSVYTLSRRMLNRSRKTGRLNSNGNEHYSSGVPLGLARSSGGRAGAGTSALSISMIYKAICLRTKTGTLYLEGAPAAPPANSGQHVSNYGNLLSQNRRIPLMEKALREEPKTPPASSSLSITQGPARTLFL